MTQLLCPFFRGKPTQAAQAGAVVSTEPRAGAETQRLRGHVPAVLARLQPMGRLAATNRLKLAIGLPLRNPQALAQLLQQISDPAHPNYRHYLTPEEFAARFSPTEQDYAAVVAFAQAHGLTITGRHPNRTLLDVNGSVADIEKALHLTLRVYQHPTEARTFYAPDVEPSLELAVPLCGISGLNDYSLPRPRLQATPLDQQSNAAFNTGSGPSGTYMGNDFRAAYVPGSPLKGAGQTVGLLQFDGGQLLSGRHQPLRLCHPQFGGADHPRRNRSADSDQRQWPDQRTQILPRPSPISC
jgi:hypothetical protein